MIPWTFLFNEPHDHMRDTFQGGSNYQPIPFCYSRQACTWILFQPAVVRWLFVVIWLFHNIVAKTLPTSFHMIDFGIAFLCVIRLLERLPCEMFCFTIMVCPSRIHSCYPALRFHCLVSGDPMSLPWPIFGRVVQIVVAQVLVACFASRCTALHGRSMRKRNSQPHDSQLCQGNVILGLLSFASTFFGWLWGIYVISLHNRCWSAWHLMEILRFSGFRVKGTYTLGS